MPPSHIWPAPSGDHRGSRRSHASGARHGRLRFCFTPPFGLRFQGVPLVDSEGHIWVYTACEDEAGRDGRRREPHGGDSALFLLSPAGVVLRSFQLPGGGWHLGGLNDTGCLLVGPNAIWVVHRDGRPEERRAVPGPILRHTPTMDGGLLLWSLDPIAAFRQSEHTGSQGYTGLILRIDATGHTRWTVPAPVCPVGYVCHAELGCDDPGHVYLSALGRIGDGVSGGDIGVGGTAILNPDGGLLGRPDFGKRPSWDVPSLCYCRAASAVFRDVHRGYCAVTPTETGVALVQWLGGQEAKRRPEHPLLGLPLRLRDTGLLDAPMLIVGVDGQPHYACLHPTITDGAGRRYLSVDGSGFTSGKSWLVAIDESLEHLWTLPYEEQRAPCPLAIGPDEVVLAGVGGRLVAIE